MLVRHAIRALTVRGDETLRRRRLVQPQRADEVEIPVRTPPPNDGAGLGLEGHVRTHFMLLSLTSRRMSHNCHAMWAGDERLPDVGRVGATILLWWGHVAPPKEE